jgi:hypothetical protein
MGLLDWFKGKKEETEYKPHLFTDEERGLSAEKRKLKNQLDMELMRLGAERDKITMQRDIEQARQDLENLQSDGIEEEGSSSMEDTLLATLLGKVLQGNKGNTDTVIPVQPVQVEQVSLPNEQLAEIWKKLPNHVKAMAKRMDDTQLASTIKGQIPNIDQDTLQRAIILVRK